MNKLAHQSQEELRAGYLSGYKGEPKPRPEKGKVFRLGRENGKAEREGNR